MVARLVALPAALIAALALAACEPAPDFVTRNGARFYLNGSTFLTQADADAQEAQLLSELLVVEPYASGRTHACVEQVMVNVVPEGKFPCVADANTRCAGEQHGRVLKIAATSCRHASAYIHELHHWLQECVAEVVDYGHTAPTWQLVEAQLVEGGRRCEEEGGAAHAQ